MTLNWTREYPSMHTFVRGYFDQTTDAALTIIGNSDAA